MSQRIDPLQAECPIVFFDGICGLCNRFIDFLLRVDQDEQFQFATLQGATAQKLLGSTEISGLKSVVLADGHSIKLRSAAVVAILKRLAWPWRAAGYGLQILPPWLRDTGYDLVAQHRYRIFGKKDTCRLPSLAERRRFLD